MIIITGGAGFIGSNLVAALEENTDEPLVVCDWLEEGEKWQNIAKRNLADIINPAELFDFLEANVESIKVIYHMGAISATTETDGDLIIENNFRLTMDLFNWCAEKGIRLIYASSAATYGDGSQGFTDTNTAEALGKLKPLNAYGWSKHLTDRRVIHARDNAKPVPPQWAGLKFFNVYGPNEYHKGGQRSVAVTLHQQIKSEGYAKLFKSYRTDYKHGDQVRDFVWVGDCVNIMLWLLENPDVSGLFNVGSGQSRSFNDLANAVFKSMDHEARIEYVDMPAGLNEKYQYFTEANMSALKKAGYTRELTSLEDGVKAYVQNYLDSEDPYR